MGSVPVVGCKPFALFLAERLVSLPTLLFFVGRQTGGLCESDTSLSALLGRKRRPFGHAAVDSVLLRWWKRMEITRKG